MRLAAPLMSVILVAACGGPVTAAGGNVLSGSQPGASTRTDGKGIVVADRHGWTSAGLEGSVPAAGSCHLRKAADGEPLPDPACTPGAVDRAVTDADVGSTVCRKGGYTASVRPPEALTESVKKKLLAAYGIPASRIRDYELDHLVELAAGGASDVRNLWPEPNTFQQFRSSGFIHNDKDAVEAYTFHAICAGTVSVSAVQKAMATDWTTAVKVLGLPPVPADYKG